MTIYADAQVIDKIECMVKDAMRPDVLVHEDRKFMVSGYHEIQDRDIEYADSLNMTTLKALAGYVEDVEDGWDKDKFFIHVKNPAHVVLVSHLDEHRDRELLITAVPEINSFRFNQLLPLEDFIISLQQNFAVDDTTVKILKIVGNMVADASVQTEDDGITQNVVAKTSLANKEHVSIPNPVLLRPFRTFPEIEQPQGAFILRVQGGVDKPTLAGLWQTESPGWKINAMEDIVSWLSTETNGIEIIG